jgi:polyhydroxyalkanoate synthesis repressor PhaR
MRTIKRYSNRKLYDTQEKKYVTLDGIAELIRQGEDVEVIENDTGEDLTAVTLSQIIFEQQKRGSSTPLDLFTNVIRFGGATTPLDLLRRSLYLPGSAFKLVEKEIERRLQELVERGEMAEEQMRRLQSELMARFTEGERKHRERDEGLLSRFNIPSHTEIQELNRRLDDLSTRLDELVAATRAARSTSVTEPNPTLPSSPPNSDNP